MNFKKILSAFCTIIICTTSFSQAISISSWAKPSYDRLKKEKILTNTFLEDENYKKNITRSEFAELIVSYLIKVDDNIKLEDGQGVFKDSKNPYVSTANKLGIVAGTGNGMFSPNNPIKREEAAVMIFKAENLIDQISSADVFQYSDRHLISQWAQGSVGGLSKDGIFSGGTDGKFKPKSFISRQESFSIIERLVKKHLEEDREVPAFKTGDDFLKKDEYKFIFENIPGSTIKLQEISNGVYNTPKAEREKLYQDFLNTKIVTTTKLKSSPNLFFKKDRTYYCIGLEINENIKEGKTEQRVFLFDLLSPEKPGQIKIGTKNFGTWTNRSVNK